MPRRLSSSRHRLVAAMIDVAGTIGYANSSVARVVEAAGASRSTFYSHFHDRDACFLAAHETAARNLSDALCAAVERSEPGRRIDAALRAFLVAVDRDPAAARLVLLQAPGGPQQVREATERLFARAETWIEAILQEQDRLRARLWMPPPVLLMAVTNLVSVRLIRDGSIPADLEGDLREWIGCYRSQLGPMIPTAWTGFEPPSAISTDQHQVALLPRGRTAPPPEIAATARRDRILDATVRLTARHGYRGVSVSDIVTAARVPRAAFYGCYGGKEMAFRAAQTRAMQEAIAAAAAQFSVPAAWPDRIWEAGKAFLTYVASHPDAATMDFIETYAVGDSAILRRHDNQLSFGLFLQGYREDVNASAVPRLAPEAIASGVFGLMRREVVRGRATSMLNVLPAATYAILSPFVGAQEAAEFIGAKVQEDLPAPRRERGFASSPRG